jgi:hypothetical protein
MAKIAQARQALGEVERLREENADLRAQVAALEEQLTAVPKPSPAKKVAPKPAS